MMLNRTGLREPSLGAKNSPAASQHRRGRSLAGLSKDADENLDLFSKNRRSLSIASSDESDEVAVPLNLRRLSVGSTKMARNGLDDLLSSIDCGKHDYDWLLTPPDTPIFPSPNGSVPQSVLAAPRNTCLDRPISTLKASRLSVTQSEGCHNTRPARSRSATRSSISALNASSYSNKSSSILNTSSNSISSCSRPSSPITHSPSASRTSTSPSRLMPSRSPTPSRTRPIPTSSIDKPRQLTNPRLPTAPISRPQIPANFNSLAARSSNSRLPTPTRRSSAPPPSVGSTPSASIGSIQLNGRSSAPPSRPNSPTPRGRSPQRPFILPDFSHDTPPNLRTTLPDRPLSAGRSRPAVTLTKRGNVDISPGSMPRRQSSPIVSRGRLTEPTLRGPNIHEPHKVSDSAMRQALKASPATSESTGFGRTISKRSLDMAIRHMEIRNGPGSNRPIPGTGLFPQSMRSAAGAKIQNGRTSSSVPTSLSRNGATAGEEGQISAKLIVAGPDIYESSRYDSILLKEKLENTNWLHSLDERSDQELVFDNGFEPLPEPFGVL